MKKQLKKPILVLCVFLVLALVCYAAEVIESQRELNSGIPRSPQGEAPYTANITAQTEDGELIDIPLDIYAREYSEKECQRLLKCARDEFEKIFLKENSSGENVQTDLYLPEKLAGGRVSAEYESSHPLLLGYDGQIYEENKQKEGTIVTLRVTFRCQDQTLLYETGLNVMPRQFTGKEKIKNEIENYLKEKEKETRENDAFILPKTIGDMTLRWKLHNENGSVYFLFAGGVAAACLYYKKKENEKKEKQRRERQLLIEYPQMVMQLSLLMGAGMNPFSAWERMVKRYTMRKERGRQDSRLFMEEMLITYREIKDGSGEIQAYEKFGRRIGLFPYQKFVSLLVQYVKKGTRDLRTLLEQEADSVQGERLNMARKLGEEAGTKLLFPMLLILLVVLIIILFPAAAAF